MLAVELLFVVADGFPKLNPVEGAAAAVTLVEVDPNENVGVDFFAEGPPPNELDRVRADGPVGAAPNMIDEK